MGCCSSKPKVPTEITEETKKKLEALTGLFVAGSIWTGTIRFGKTEEPWEVHVIKSNNKGLITAKRVDDFAKSTFIEAECVSFDAEWEERDGEYVEVISFSWKEEHGPSAVQLYTDDMDGTINIRERRLSGMAYMELPEDGDSGSDAELVRARGVFDMYRCNAPKKLLRG